MKRALVLAAALACACGARAPSNAVDAWEYIVTPPPAGESVVRVEATFGGAEKLSLPDDGESAVRSVEQRVGDAWRAASREGDGWELSSCRAPCTVRYAIDLQALVQACGHHLDCGMSFDGGTLGPMSRWLLRPAGEAAIALRVRGDGPHAFGMRKRGDAYVFRASELVEGSYTAFGAMRRRRMARDDAAIDVAFLGPGSGATDGEHLKWLGDCADVLARFYGGRFPVDATLFVLPVDGDAVRFGSVMALTGASIALFVGRDMPMSAAHEDWVVVHELFHLGTPTFQGEGRWLGEGLATYYEPLLRARAGWISEEKLWRHFDEEMPRGVRPDGSAPDIEDRRDIDSMYWGGALFAMLADLRIREATNGAKSLDDALRAAHARGADVTRVWKMREFLRVGDEATGTHVLSELHESFATRGDPIDLPRELARAKKRIPVRAKP